MPTLSLPAARKAGWLAAQLFVVFVGVYAAFLLERHQESKRALTRVEQLSAVLASEVNSIAYGMGRQLESFDSVYFRPMARWAQGDRSTLPLPRPFYQVYGDLETPELQILLTTGGLDALNPELLLTLRRYNQSTRDLLQVSRMLNVMSAELLAPAMAGGTEAFYYPDGRFREEFDWYPAMIQRLRMSMAEVTSWAGTLASQLGVDGDEPPP